MQRQRTRDTAPELALRSVVHRAGLRYRIDVRPLPMLRRKADLVFTKARVAVFVDGCFWHGCPVHGGQPRANAQWWRAKLNRTQARDAETTERLLEEGWRVVRVWEHEPPQDAAARIVEVVRQDGSSNAT
jgi:DNA mismatch endonuclease (patch repair protein)